MASGSRQLLGRGSVYTLATAAPMLAALLITPALTRALTQNQYGHVSVGLTVMQFTFNLLAMGLPTAITRHALVEHSGPAGARGIAARGALIALGISVLGFTVVWTALGTGTSNTVAISIGLLAGGAGSGIAMAQALSLAEDRPWHYVGLAFGMSLLAPTAGLATVLLWSASAAAYLLVVCITYFAVDVFAFVQIIRSGEVTWGWDDFRAALSVALPMIPHQLAVGTTTAAAIWIAAARLGVEAAAESQPSLQLATMPLVITSALSYAWTPIVLRATPQQKPRLLEETGSVVTWLASLGGVVVAALAPWVLRFLTPYELSRMVPLTALTSLTAAIAAVYLAHLQLVLAQGATRALALLSPLALLAGAVASWFLSPKFALVALGAGYLLTYALLLVFTRGIAHRVQAVRWREQVVVAPIVVGMAGALLGSLLGWTTMAEVTVRLGVAGVAGGLALWKLYAKLRSPEAADIESDN